MGSMLVDLGCWLAVGATGVVAGTQALGWSGTRLLAAVHALTPYLAIPIVVVVVVALWLSLIHISEPTRQLASSRMPSSA